MNFLNRFFSQRTLNIVGGTCICIIIIVLTLAFIELVLINSNTNGARYSILQDRIEEFIINEKEVVISCDTIQGQIFGFKNQFIVPIIETKQDSTGKHQTILNFLVLGTDNQTENKLFTTNQHIWNSQIIEIENIKLWFIETQGCFYLFDERKDNPIEVKYPHAFSLVFPEKETTISEELDFEENKPLLKEKSEIKPILINTDYPPLTLVNNQVLIQAHSCKNDNLYWFYNMTNKTIRSVKGLK